MKQFENFYPQVTPRSGKLYFLNSKRKNSTLYTMYTTKIITWTTWSNSKTLTIKSHMMVTLYFLNSKRKSSTLYFLEQTNITLFSKGLQVHTLTQRCLAYGLRFIFFVHFLSPDKNREPKPCWSRTKSCNSKLVQLPSFTWDGLVQSCYPPYQICVVHEFRYRSQYNSNNNIYIYIYIF